MLFGIIRYKQDKQEDEETIMLLKNKITELKTSLRNMMTAVKHTEDKSSAVAKSLQSNEQAVLKKQVGSRVNTYYFGCDISGKWVEDMVKSKKEPKRECLKI